MSEPLQAIADDVFLSLEHPLQPKRFALALFFALILFPLIAAGLVAGTVILIVPFFAFLLWISGRTMFAHFMGNSILVSELNYPRIHRIGEDVKAAIGYKKNVNIFVYEQGNFNAFLMKFFFYRRAVFLNSELLEAGVTDDELRWLIGRFIGYLRARRQAGFWGWTIRAAQRLLVFNLFLLPYERALVYSGDRIALAVITGDISSAISAMQKIFVGRQLGYSVNPNGMVDQHRMVKGSIFALLARLFMAFPHMTARYVDLIGFAKERFPAQFERFETANPGLPPDLRQLTALPQADAARPATKDSVWKSLAGAVALLALLTFLTVKVMENVVAPTPAAVSQLQPYISTVGRFSVLFPGTPRHNTQRVALSNIDSVTLYQVYFEGDNSSYMVRYNDYPARYAIGEPQSFLERVRNANLPSANATLISDQPINLKGVPGRIFKFTDKDGNSFTVRAFLDGRRLYEVIVTVGPGSSANHAKDFLNSFRIL